MKRFLLRLLIFALLVALVALALGPTAFRQYRLWEQAKVVNSYAEASNRLSAQECVAMLSLVYAYDEARGSVAWTDPYADRTAVPPDGEYASLLDPAGSGVMCLLELPKLGATLPVYHGGGTPAPEARVEHLPESSLPVGRAGGQCALCARRERFCDPFAGLDRLIAGDCFLVHIPQETLTYEVSSVKVVPADALYEPAGGDGADECALIAEGADGGRLVVRGQRISRRHAKPTDDSRLLPQWQASLVFAAPVAVPCILLLAVIEWLRRAVRRHKRRRIKL